MITIGMNYKVKEGKEADFERACKRVLEVMSGIEGHTRSNIYRDITSANSYLIVSDWNSRDAFDGFIASEAFAKVTNWGKEQILTERPKHDFYTPQS